MEKKLNLRDVTFAIGPSQLKPEVKEWIKEIADSGLLSISHRSSRFAEINKHAIEGLHKSMKIPADYKIFYQPSATVAMDAILANVVRKKSFHFVHGAFSGLFYTIALAIGKEAQAYEKTWDVPSVSWEEAKIPADTEMIGICHSESSTGLMWPREEIKKLRNRYPGVLLTVDVTSSFGGMQFDWTDADLWFGSVQKCVGLPSGLGFIIVGPRAFEKSINAIGPSVSQSFVHLDEKMKFYQTPETPNVLDIALLARQMENWDLEKIEAEQFKKAKLIYDAEIDWKPFVKDSVWRSHLPCVFEVDDAPAFMKKLDGVGITLTIGYVPLNLKTIRIANYPSIPYEYMKQMLKEVEKLFPK
jgi:phosphoserine aminotransferase